MSGPKGITATTAADREAAERNESPQVVAHRAYIEAVIRLGCRLSFPEREEIAIKEALSALQRHYLLQQEPWIKKLMRLEAMKPINVRVDTRNVIT